MDAKGSKEAMLVAVKNLKEKSTSRIYDIHIM